MLFKLHTLLVVANEICFRDETEISTPADWYDKKQKSEDDKEEGTWLSMHNHFMINLYSLM